MIKQTLSEAITYIGWIRKVSSVPTKLFMYMYEKYAIGLSEIPLEKRNRYLKKVGKKGLDRDSVFVLTIFNKIDELAKIEMMLSLLGEKIDCIIDDRTY